MTKATSMNSRLDAAVMVVHGPEIFDCGDVGRFMRLLSPSRTIVAGVMARTAAEESGLPVEFDGRPPSRVILAQSEPVYLANRGKTQKSGRIFGDIVASRLIDQGLVQLECSNHTVYCWNNGDIHLAAALSHFTGYDLQFVKNTPHCEGDVRGIRGCIPGEAVYVNGIIIGRATSDVVVIGSDKGMLTPISGLDLKPHGIEKLSRNGCPDLSTAWCKSGAIRSVAPRNDGYALRVGRILVIDHCGHEIYARLRNDCCGILAVGDDTTAVCGHICTHRGIPVLGIVDGDRDTIVPCAFAPGSVVVETLGERDDDVGSEIAGRVPDEPLVWSDWVEGILEYLKDRVRVVIDTRVDSDDAVHTV